MSERFYSTEPLSVGVPARLEGPEAHHLLHVMRGGVGQRVTLFDGAGAEYSAEVTATGRRDVELAVLARDEVDREPPVAITAGVAMPKGDRQKVLVEKLTELGVARLIPIETERGVATPKPSALEKLRRLVIEASKQCGRNRLMAIDDPTPLAEFLASAEGEERLIAHPGGEPLETASVSIRRVALAIGPEGGFSDVEAALAAERAWKTVSLGRSILRVETAAIVLAGSRANAVRPV